MNDLVTQQHQEAGLAISTETKELSQALQIALSSDTRGYRGR